MDDAVLPQLRSALAQKPDMVKEPNLTQGVLRDLCGPDKNRREIAALSAAVRESVPAELAAARNTGLSATLGDRLVRRLLDNAALDEEAARWAVQTWAQALGIAGLRLSPPAPYARPAATSVGGPGSAQARDHIARLARKALDLATSIPVENSRAVALGMVAAALTPVDADQAARLLGEAELLVGSVASENAQIRQRHDLAVAVAGCDPDRAERLALSVRGPMRDDALGCLAHALAVLDMDRAQRLAWAIDHESLRMHALTGLVMALAGTEPDRAARLARSLTGEYWQAEALCQVAAELVIEDPDRAAALVEEAELLARSSENGLARAAALSGVGKAMAGRDPGRAAGLFDEAEQLARSLPDEPARAPALGSLATALAASDPERALRLARSLPDSWYAVGEIAKTLAGSDPHRALSLAQSITNETPHLADVAVALTRADPDSALRLARSITSERWRASALTGIAGVLAAWEPDRAARLLSDVERLADQMTDDLDRVIALVDMAASWARG